MSAPPTTVSLVLGSGGARGLAHIGAIQWLIENGYEIRSIAGASMGALIGGIYAAGKLDGALVNPLPIAPTLDDATDLTIVVSLSGLAEALPPAAPLRLEANGSEYRRHVRAFIENLYPPRTPSAPARGLLDVAFASMQTMQDTITRLKLADFSPDVSVGIPRNACGYFEFWRAREMIALGRERTARSFAGLMSSSVSAHSPREPV